MIFVDKDWRTRSRRWPRENKGLAITREIVEEATRKYFKEDGTVGTFEDNGAGSLPRANGADVYEYLLDN